MPLSFKQTAPLLVKFNSEFSTEAVEEAKATSALPFVDRKRKKDYRVVLIGQLSFDCRSSCGRSHHMQSLLYKRVPLRLAFN